MRKAMLAAIVLCFATAVALYFGATTAAQAEPAADTLTGTWQCLAHGIVHNGQPGDVHFTLTLQQDGENISGHVSSDIGEADLSSGTFRAHHLRITINGEENTYTLEADHKDGTLSGTWMLSGTQQKGTWEGKKAAQQ